MGKLLLASDPEMFVKTREGIISSAAGLLGCDKWNKLPLVDGINLQEDNVLVEFDIPPADSFEGFNNLIKMGIEESRKIILPHGLEIAEGISSHIYTQDEINSFDKSVLTFGCVPDFNGLNGIKNPIPTAEAGLRSAGGHVHFGFDDFVEVSEYNQARMTIMCDLFMGMASLLLDSDSRRRQLYGKAGSIRYKDYGIEYRTLSNFWVFEERNRRWLWEQAMKAYDSVKDEDIFYEFVAMISPEEVQRVINEDDKVMAEQYIKMAGVM